MLKYQTINTVDEPRRTIQINLTNHPINENQLTINIDGLRQAETLSFLGFNEHIDAYGNVNNSRNGENIKTLKEANITKATNSIKSGSCSLGGAVIYDTKDARDYLLSKDYYVSYKN